MPKNNSKFKLFLLLLITGYVLYISLLFLCFYYFNTSQIKSQLIDLHFYFLELNFFLIIVGFILIIPFFKNLISTIPRRVVYLLLGLTNAGTLITSFVAPQTHRIFYDEDIYENIGQNLATLQKAQLCNDGGTTYGVYSCHEGHYNKEPYAYPLAQHSLSIVWS